MERRRPSAHLVSLQRSASSPTTGRAPLVVSVDHVQSTSPRTPTLTFVGSPAAGEGIALLMATHGDGDSRRSAGCRRTEVGGLDHASALEVLRSAAADRVDAATRSVRRDGLVVQLALATCWAPSCPPPAAWAGTLLSRLIGAAAHLETPRTAADGPLAHRPRSSLPSSPPPTNGHPTYVSQAAARAGRR